MHRQNIEGIHIPALLAPQILRVFTIRAKGRFWSVMEGKRGEFLELRGLWVLVKQGFKGTGDLGLEVSLLLASHPRNNGSHMEVFWRLEMSCPTHKASLVVRRYLPVCSEWHFDCDFVIKENEGHPQIGAEDKTRLGEVDITSQ